MPKRNQTMPGETEDVDDSDENELDEGDVDSDEADDEEDDDWDEDGDEAEDGEEQEQASTTSARVETYKVVQPLLDSMRTEFRELSRKKPDATVSKLKVTVVNRLLERCRDILAEEPELEFLDLLADESLPQTSDVLIVLSQHVTAMHAYEKRYHYRDSDYASAYWHVNDEDEQALEE